MNRLRRLLDRSGKLLWPNRCVLCDRLLEEGDICLPCANAAGVYHHNAWKILHVKDWTALWQYNGAVRDSLIRCKFRRRRNYCDTYGSELAKKLQSVPFSFDLVTWVPVSFLRRWERGYDQVELITRRVGKELGTEAVKTLHKHRHNRRQARIKGKDARIANVRGVYRAVAPENFRGKRVMLIDDIVTTGATVCEAARVLKKAGASAVYVACVAAATGWQNFST